MARLVGPLALGELERGRAVEAVGVSHGQRLPPHDLRAEEAVLGAAMLSGDAMATVLERLGEDDFYRPAHRTVFAAVRDLHHRGTRSTR